MSAADMDLYREVFDILDTDGDGHISRQEFYEALGKHLEKKQRAAQAPQFQLAFHCVCGMPFTDDSIYCRECGRKRGPAVAQGQPFLQQAFPSVPMQPNGPMMQGQAPLLMDEAETLSVATSNTTTRSVAPPRTDSEFPYHDVFFGTSWRYHFPDSLDEQLLGSNLGGGRPTPLETLRHAAFMEALRAKCRQDRSQNSGMGVIAARSSAGQWGPRRVQEPTGFVLSRVHQDVEL
mmetsp:Transcript_95046/g.268448  ORF Transcript_95046/g.268448 Transcript_95046/m.268448 type:complete len:234 (+) Transcript_95046:118-819(+)